MLTSPININQLHFQSRFTPKPLTAEDLKAKVDNLPVSLMRDLGAKLYPLMNLTWGYVETIISLCIEMKLTETKSLTREIRELKRGYDQFRQFTMGDKETAQEEEMGAWIEEQFVADFDKLFSGIDMEARKFSNTKDQRMLIVSIHQCLTLIEAVKRYALWADNKIKEHGAWTTKYCMVQTDFLKMHEVIKKFPTSSEPSFIPLRDLSARILENRLHQIKVGVNDEGNIWLQTSK